jgi:hypothetical protein
MALATNNLPQAAASANDIRNIKPPVAIPTGWEWVWWTLGALIVAALLTLLVRYLRRRMKTRPKTPPVPAHVRARQKLNEALALIAQPKPCCTAVSDIIRQYLEERFNFRAPERTTEEFLYELQDTNLLGPDQKDSLGGFLQQCDLVKFAKYEPGEPELRELHGSAIRLIDETQPPTVDATQVVTTNSELVNNP